MFYAIVLLFCEAEVMKRLLGVVKLGPSVVPAQCIAWMLQHTHIAPPFLPKRKGFSLTNEAVIGLFLFFL